MARLQDKYADEIVPEMLAASGAKSPLSVPRLEKIVVSMGVGSKKDDPKALERATEDLTTIAGQRAVVTRAKKSVSSFRLREGNPVGCMVTLRGKRMYEFLDRLISVVLPRIRDFRGVKTTSFDQAGNYSMGLQDQVVFPEIRADRVSHYQGMNITLTIRRSDPERSQELLRRFGMPFRK